MVANATLADHGQMLKLLSVVNHLFHVAFCGYVAHGMMTCDKVVKWLTFLVILFIFIVFLFELTLLNKN